MRSFLFALGLALASAGTAHAIPSAGARPKTTRHPAASELTELARTAITTSAAKLPKGATLVAARPSAGGPVAIPIAPTRVTIDMTPAPRRAGTVTAAAVLVFWKESDVSARVPLTLELSVPPEALLYDVQKGGVLTLVVRRGLIEVSVQAVASADADIGDVVQVLLRPSGRALRAQVIAKDRALAVEDGR